MMEPLGASQVLSYLYKIADTYDFHLITLEKQEDFDDTSKLEDLKKELKEKGIVWYPLRYSNSKLGKFFNFIRFTKAAKSVVKSQKLKYVHCRSYVTAVSVYYIQKFHEVKYLFDTRNFSFDERADTGGLDRGKLPYKLGKKLERKLYENASGIIILSKIGKETILTNQLFPGGDKIENIEFITTCVDLDRFEIQKREFKKEVITIGYVGTATGWYDFEKTVITLKKIKEQVKIKFLVFNSNQYGQHSFIANALKKQGFKDEEFQIEKVSFRLMPQRLQEIDIALFYIHPYFSKRASAATKMGELLATGIPILTNKGVGDHEYYIQNYNVGKILEFEKLNSYNFTEIIPNLLNEETAQRCRNLSEKYFSLDKAIKKYKNIYKKIFI